MTDRTNKEKPHLGQTIKAIGLIYESLVSLHERVYPESPLWFSIMAQGSVDQIRDLLDDVEWLMEDMIPKDLPEGVVSRVQPVEEAAVLLEAA